MHTHHTHALMGCIFFFFLFLKRTAGTLTDYCNVPHFICFQALSCRAEWKGWVREWMTGRKETGYWPYQQTVAAMGSTAWWSLMWVQCQCHCKQSVSVIANRMPVCLQTVSLCLQTECLCYCEQCQCHCKQCQHQCHCKQCQHQCHCKQSVSVALLLTPAC